MFEVPEAKRVRREHLRDSDESDASHGRAASPDAALQARLNAHIARSLGLDPASDPGLDRGQGKADGSSPVRAAAAAAAADDDDDDSARPAANASGAVGVGVGDGYQDELGAFEFKLFSASVVPAAAAPKVVLDDDAADLGEGDIVRKRPPEYYLAVAVPDELRRQYEFAAVTGDDVLARSRQRSWGLEMPWKVTTIVTTPKARHGEAPKASAVAVAASHHDASDPAASGRRRQGKKARIAQRKKQRAQAERQAAAARRQADKEEHVKDKKKRLNRVKKLRRRAKEREKKHEAGTAQGGEGSGADSASE